MTYPTVTLNDGTKIPQLGLGVWKAVDGDEVKNAVTVAIQSGYRLIDTAAVYKNEAGVGAGIAAAGVARDELFITTKLWNSDQGAKNVRPALIESLQKLGLDYVDLYLIHWPTPARDLYVETWREFEKLKDEGLVRSIGVSNFHIEQLETLKRHKLTTPSVNQIELHPGFGQQELRDYAKANGIVIESWSPLGQGGDLLSEASITKIAQSHDKSPAQVIIRWHLQHNLVVIPKSVNDNRIKENFDVFDFELSGDEMRSIDELENGKRLGPNPDTMNIH